MPEPAPATPAFPVTSVKVPSWLLWYRRFQYLGLSFWSDGIAAPFNIAPTMAPRTNHQKIHVVSAVFRLGRRIGGGRTIDILLVPLAMHIENRDRQGLARHNLVNRLDLPIIIIGRVTHQSLPEW